MISNKRIRKQYIDIMDGITFESELWVKVLEVTIDDRRQFNEVLCLWMLLENRKILYAFSRLSKHIRLCLFTEFVSCKNDFKYILS